MTEPASKTRPEFSKFFGSLFVLCVGMPLCLSGLLRHQNPYIGYNDDFFYYLQIARNFATHGVSTFNGLNLTNGYHPMWMLMLALLYKLAPARVFLYCLQISVVGFGLLTYLLARRALLLFSTNTGMATVFAVAVACSTFIFRTGMEATIAIPAMLLLLGYRLRPEFSFAHNEAVIYGLLGSLAVLSRLDIAILILLLVVGDVAVFGWRRVVPKLPWMALGALPLFVYLGTNAVYFHTLLPVSGIAKHLRFHHTPSLFMFERVFLYPEDKAILLGGGAAAEALLLLFLAAGLVKLSRPARSVLWAIALFPVVFCMVEVLWSDWPLFLWYLYPVPAIFFAAMVCVLRLLKDAPRFQRLALAIAAAVLFVVCGYYTVHAVLHGPWPMREVAGIDQRVVEFINAHPGIYAMGDRAGLVGYLSPSPIVQLEGLTMDKPFLANIAAQAELHSVLRRYHVRYYILSLYADSIAPGGCYDAVESEVAGPDSKKMRGRFCGPIATWVDSHRVFLIYDLGTNQVSATP